MKLPKQQLTRVVTAGLLVGALTSCSKEPPQPLRIGTNVWPGFEAFYLARDLGYYKDTPVRLVEYPSSSEVLRAYRSGELEAAALTLDEALSLAATDPQLRIVLVTDISNGADVILAKPDIQNLRSLKGKRVGVESTALGAYVLTRALQKVEMSPQDVKIVSLEASEHERAFKAGKVDAVVTFEPVRSNLLATGAKLLFDSTQIPGEVVDVVAVRGDSINRQEDSTSALVKGWFRGLEYLKNNPQDAARRVAPREAVTPEQFLKSLEGLQIPDVQGNQQLLGKTDASLLNGAKQLSQVMVANKLLSKPVDPAPLLDDRLVRQIKP
jgi:NitT/TauT family transport system substrate-binding protein